MTPLVHPEATMDQPIAGAPGARLLLLAPFLRSLSDPVAFARRARRALQALAVLAVVGVAVASYDLWFAVFGSGGAASARAVLALLTSQALLLALGYLLVNVLLVRAEDAGAAPDAPRPVAAVAAVALEAAGEVAACAFAVAGLATAAAVALEERHLAREAFGAVPLVHGVGWLGALAVGAAAALVALAAGHFLAEGVRLLVAIERNGRDERR